MIISYHVYTGKRQALPSTSGDDERGDPKEVKPISKAEEYAREPYIEERTVIGNNLIIQESVEEKPEEEKPEEEQPEEDSEKKSKSKIKIIKRL